MAAEQLRKHVLVEGDRFHLRLIGPARHAFSHVRYRPRPLDGWEAWGNGVRARAIWAGSRTRSIAQAGARRARANRHAIPFGRDRRESPQRD